ncbi:MAG TPA: hypothetical protein VFC19_48700 [Candidatus Limnocylindrales bacterium]|nr:hypothetical protein [Candidatus Limnocylindrales bacterium]
MRTRHSTQTSPRGRRRDRRRPRRDRAVSPALPADTAVRRARLQHRAARPARRPARRRRRAAARLEAAHPGAFAVTQVADATAADALLKDRSAYAAFVLASDGVSLHTASAASPTVAALLTAAAQQLAPGRPVPITDVAPLPADDPRGTGFAAGFFPLMIASLIAAVLLFSLVPRKAARLLGVLLFSAFAGLAGAFILQTWMGIIGGDMLPVAAVIGLIALAVSASVLGLAAIIGPAGIGLGAILIMLVGNALAGVGGAPELLPQPWGEVGQWLPIGAGATALRSAAWFDFAGADSAMWTLGAWAVAGILLLALAWLRQPSAPSPSTLSPDAPAPHAAATT